MITRTSRSRFAGSAVALAGIGAACALVVTGCGSSSPAPATTTAAATATTTAATGAASGASTTAGGGFAAYQTCLKAHGVTFPSGGGFFRRGGAGGTTTAPTGTTPARPALSPAEQKGLAACASLRPSGGFGAGGGGGFLNSSNPAFAKLEACLKQHGVTSESAASRGSSAFRTAFAACRSLLPAGGFGGGFGAAGGGGAAGASSSTFAKYQACLKQHGLQPGAAGQSPGKLQAAISACRSVLPGGGRPTTTTG